MNAAIVPITFDTLGKLLRLPDGHQIVAAYQQGDMLRLHLLVVGPDFPAVNDSIVLRQFEPHFIVRTQVIQDYDKVTRIYKHTEFDGWGAAFSGNWKIIP